MFAILMLMMLTAAPAYEESSLIQSFTAYGLGVGRDGAEFILDRRGQPAVLTTDSLGNRVILQRHVEDELGVVSGVWRINGIPYEFDGEGLSDGGTYTQDGIEVYAQADYPVVWITDPPYELKLSAQDSTFYQSGDIYIRFDADCVPDTMVYAPRALGGRSVECDYRVLVEQQDSTYAWQPVFDDISSTKTLNHFALNPGTYRVWAALKDSLGFEGHYLGPVRINAGEACPGLR